jgi:RHS repeat-associated protein
VTTEFLVDKNRDYAQVLEESVNDVVAASYVYGLDLISQERGNADSYYFVDGLGSTRGLTNASGVVTDTYAYDAFGNLIASAGNIENDYLFAGEQFDEDLGQYYLRDRYYNPSVGRFTRVDTYQGRRSDPMSRHDYLYTHANPVNYIDPSGLYTTTMGDLNQSMAAIGALSAISWVSWAVPTLKFATAISITAFLASYGIYLAMSASGDNEWGEEDDDDGETEDNTEDEGTSQKKKRGGGGKNAQHGKAENQPSQEKQLQELEEQLKNATSKKDKVKINTKIQNIKREMAKRRKGENHSQKAKK